MLHDHKQLFIGFNNLIELDDVGVSNFLEDFNFASNTLNVLLVVNLFLFEDFHGHFFARKNVLALFDMTKSTFAKSLA